MSQHRKLNKQIHPVKGDLAAVEAARQSKWGRLKDIGRKQFTNSNAISIIAAHFITLRVSHE
jgi:hypothetical protein